MIEFKIGDIIKCKDGETRYNITTGSARMEVLGYEGPREIQVKVISHKDEYSIGTRHLVESKFFELADKKESKESTEEDKSIKKIFIANKRKTIIEEIKANKDFMNCFNDIKDLKKEVNSWTSEQVLNYKLNGIK